PLHAGQVDRHALAVLGARHVRAVHLEAPHTRRLAARQHAQRVAFAHRAGDGGPGHPHAAAADHDGTADRQAEVAGGRAPGGPAPTGKSTRSMPCAPASMLRMKRSWPGTSTMPARSPSASRYAKPRSIEMPRSFSSLRRSVSWPVSARMSEVLPWSMCPAVPMMSGMSAVARGLDHRGHPRCYSLAARTASG